MKSTVTCNRKAGSISGYLESANSGTSKLEERKASTMKITGLKRYSQFDVPCTPTPKKPIPLDPSFLRPFQTRHSEILHSQESLTSAISSLSTKPRKRSYAQANELTTKRSRKELSEAKSLSSPFIHKLTGETKFFRCYHEDEIVHESIAKEAKLVQNIYDDDCETDEDQITQAVRLVKRQLEQAIDLN